ncbi:unnamed protein product [Chilo suppressalis]|uniref:G-protein coupled receptors family 1 profile domain-containing protein n=1 Tax=Chilo suppressalis TaxID=168631 RepID=A0ABN8BJZ9_CHISP|nr:unnamed protein product [Chilo suppressalis]
MKERKRVAWILLLLAVLFALCWMPYNIMQLLLDINAVNPKDLSMYLPYALFIGHANSAINPIVYCLMTRNFQRSARKLLCGRGVCQQTHFTWRCTQKPDGSSSDYELYHEPHKRCYLQFKCVQFPVSVCFAITINKSQGQTLRAAGVYLRTSCFSHGQLYVACSRLSHVPRPSRRTAPADAHSAEMLQRYGHIDFSADSCRARAMTRRDSVTPAHLMTRSSKYDYTYSETS